MVKKLICSFCGKEIEPGRGIMFVKNTGEIYYFCSSKCYKYMIELRKDKRKVKWVRKRMKISSKER